MVNESDIHKRARVLRDVGGHPAGTECTIVEVVDGRMMLEFDDGDWGDSVLPEDLELIAASGSAAA